MAPFSPLQDYEDFDVANEDDVLEEFLGIPRDSPKLGPEGGSGAENGVGKLAQDGAAVNGDSTTGAPVPSDDKRLLTINWH